MPINNEKEKVNEIVSRNWKLGDEVGLAVEIHSFLLEAEARGRKEAKAELRKKIKVLHMKNKITDKWSDDYYHALSDLITLLEDGK